MLIFDHFRPKVEYEIEVMLGGIDRKNCAPPCTLRRVAETIIHPNYTKPRNDIAILK